METDHKLRNLEGNQELKRSPGRMFQGEYAYAYVHVYVCIYKCTYIEYRRKGHTETERELDEEAFHILKGYEDGRVGLELSNRILCGSIQEL